MVKKTTLLELRDLMTETAKMALEVVIEMPEHRAVLLPIYKEALKKAEIIDERGSASLEVK